MQIYINNTAVEVPAGITLTDVLSQHGMDAPGTAVAVDNKVVARADRETFSLSEGARIIVIKAACGG